MRILVEGFDGTGKSTLCRALSVALDCDVWRPSPSPPVCSAQLNYRVNLAINKAINSEAIIFDRWPLISDFVYGGNGSIVRIDATLRLARIDRIIHCDVDHPGKLRIEARPGDELDLYQTMQIMHLADTKLDAYRALMKNLRILGHDVKRYAMRTK
jgi:hypothetical protein